MVVEPDAVGLRLGFSIGISEETLLGEFVIAVCSVILKEEEN